MRDCDIPLSMIVTPTLDKAAEFYRGKRGCGTYVTRHGLEGFPGHWVKFIRKSDLQRALAWVDAGATTYV